MTKQVFAALFAVALVFGACGGDDDDEGSGSAGPTATSAATQPGGNGGSGNTNGNDGDDSDFHACSLFTGDEMSEILEASMDDGRDYLSTAARATTCEWQGDVVIYIEVLLDGGDGWFEAIHMPDAEATKTEEVDGLGDKALWDEFLGTLDVVQDDRFISIQPLVGFSGLDSKEVAIDLARRSLERLP